MIIPDWLKCYGDMKFRGECESEAAEQIAFFGEVRRCYPGSLGLIALHPKNEEKRKGRQFQTLISDKSKGFCKSASDIIIPGNPSFVCEMKRENHTKSKWQEGQLEYLKAAMNNGSFVCIALGAKAALDALADWMIINEHR